MASSGASSRCTGAGLATSVTVAVLMRRIAVPGRASAGPAATTSARARAGPHAPPTNLADNSWAARVAAVDRGRSGSPGPARPAIFFDRYRIESKLIRLPRTPSGGLDGRWVETAYVQLYFLFALDCVYFLDHGHRHASLARPRFPCPVFPRVAPRPFSRLPRWPTRRTASGLPPRRSWAGWPTRRRRMPRTSKPSSTSTSIRYTRPARLCPRLVFHRPCPIASPAAAEIRAGAARGDQPHV